MACGAATGGAILLCRVKISRQVACRGRFYACRHAPRLSHTRAVATMEGTIRCFRVVLASCHGSY